MRLLRNAKPPRRPDEKAEGGAKADGIGTLDSPNSISPPDIINITVPDVNTSAPCAFCGGVMGPAGRGFLGCDACGYEIRAPRGEGKVRA